MIHETPALRWLPLWLATGWALTAAVIYLSLSPAPPHFDLPQSDKLGHVLAYGVLMYWFMQIYEAGRVRVGFAAGFIALGIVLEILQGFTGYRTFDVHDMAANTAGVAIGWTFAPPRTPNLFTRIENLVLS